MGRVKSALIKRTGKRLTEEEEFTSNFNENKDILGTTMPSKRMRNILAGYITRLNKSYAKQKQEA